MSTPRFRTAITPTREDDYPQWYQEIVKAADLAESSVVRGCMVIKPWGYALWENIQKALDHMIKETGHQNFYFPLFVPLSFLEKEAEHVEGFAKECAVVTHHRLESQGEKGLVPAGPLEEPLVVRPTSEAIIGEAYARWIQSYRDLPLLGNQWANVVRWEMRPRIFLRTSEFLWQEGHTAHATKEEALEETLKMLEVYRVLCEDYLALPLVLGEKTAQERFPGAEKTYTLEAMMQDKKAIQAGTSHFLGQNFSRAFNIKFLSVQGKQEFVWTTSWGVTTRLIGGLLMAHGDDNGVVLPPRVAPLHVVIVPVMHKSQEEEALVAYCETLKTQLEAQQYHGAPLRVHFDRQDRRPGDKLWGWIKKGVPVRLEVGPKELQQNTVCLGRRDHDPGSKEVLSLEACVRWIPDILKAMQEGLFKRALQFQKDHTYTVTSAEEFHKHFSGDTAQTGFLLAPWIGDDVTAQHLKETYKVTARCIPLKTQGHTGQCIFTGTSDAPLTLFARSY